MEKITIGMVATRRNVFSKEEAKRFKDIILEKLAALPIDVIDINDINEEGLLFDEKDIPAVVSKLKKAGSGRSIHPSLQFRLGNAGIRGLPPDSEACAFVERPRMTTRRRNGSRTRDSQCGLFATGISSPPVQRSCIHILQILSRTANIFLTAFSDLRRCMLRG